jgi:hypothetical protein
MEIMVEDQRVSDVIGCGGEGTTPSASLGGIVRKTRCRENEAPLLSRTFSRAGDLRRTIEHPNNLTSEGGWVGGYRLKNVQVHKRTNYRIIWARFARFPASHFYPTGDIHSASAKGVRGPSEITLWGRVKGYFCQQDRRKHAEKCRRNGTFRVEHQSEMCSDEKGGGGWTAIGLKYQEPFMHIFMNQTIRTESEHELGRPSHPRGTTVRRRCVVPHHRVSASHR